ncbi:MAG: hypothetical protein KY445_06125 [Armatimonadetes bacterium]|nr:hypothetical protein [Armatimonadota bacterium]
MERNMMWGALGLGCIGWLAALLLTTSKRPQTSLSSEVSSRENSPRVWGVSRPFWWLAFLLPLGVWLATLPTTPPFSSGQGWGRGFLLGGAASLACALVILRASSRAPESNAPLRAAATAPLFAALICVGVPLLWMRASVIDALMGVAVGWIAVAAVLLLGVWAEKGDSPSASATSVLLLNGAAFAATLCGVAALGVYRDFAQADVARGTNSAVALVLTAGVALALLSGVLIQEIASSAASLRARFDPFLNGLNLLLCLGMPLGIGILLGLRIFDDLALIYVIGAGSALGLLLWWLAWDAARESQNGESGLRSSVAAGVVVALCGFMLAFQILQGFGVGLMLLAAWPSSILALPSFAEESQPSNSTSSRAAPFEAAQTLALLLSFVAILLISRLFATRFRADLRGAGLDDHFALFGFVGGAVAPVLLASLWFSARERGAAASLPRLLGLGALALALLGAMLTLWGAKVVPAFFAGLALAAAGLASGFAPRIHSGAVALFSLAVALTLAQWTHHFAPFAEMARAQRLQFLAWGVGATVLLILIVEITARLASGARGRKTDLAAPSEGAS